MLAQYRTCERAEGPGRRSVQGEAKMNRTGFCNGVLLCLFIGLAWPALRGQAWAGELRYQERTFTEWKGDLENPSPQVRVKAVRALQRFGPIAVAAVAGALKDVSAEARLAAAWTLGEMGPVAKDAVPALGQALGDLNVQVRQTAAWALGMVGPAAKDAVPELTRALKDSGNVVRANAAQALGAIGPEAKTAAVALAELALGGHSYVGGNATNALRAIGPGAIAELRRQAERDPQIQPFLEEALHIIRER